ncbi:MAG: HD domain-containing protein [Spirochaetales bacterium]|nr:HD domain-containing protein [Spirochaetales bacterium]
MAEKDLKVNDLLDTIEILCAEYGKLGAIMEVCYNGAFEIDEEGKFLFTNPAFLKTFLLESSETNKVNFFEIVSSPRVKRAVHALFAGRVKTFAERVELVVKPNGKRIVELTMRSIELRGRKYVIGVFDDRTEFLTAIKNRELSINLLYRLINSMKIETKDTIYQLARLVEVYDRSTGDHLERMEHYMRTLSGEYYRTYRERDPHLTAKYIEDLSLAAILHDIGKVGVSSEILLKPGRLTPSEFELIKRHTTLVAEALTGHKGGKDYITLAREIAVSHHERWDGKGYPRGLYGENIPLSARLTAVCDVYDTLVSIRPYKKAQRHEQAVATVAGERGKAFDPEIVDVFMRVHMLFKDIHDRQRGEKKAV